jgi:hypothetical protein
VEIQGTAEDGLQRGRDEGAHVRRRQGHQELIAMQRAVLGDVVLKKPRPEPTTA